MADIRLDVIDLASGQIIGIVSLTINEEKLLEIDVGSYRFRATYLRTGQVLEIDRTIIENANTPLDFTFVAPIPPQPTKMLVGFDFGRLVPYSAPYNQSPLQYYNLLDFITNTGKTNCIRFHSSYNDQYGYNDSSYPNAKIWYQQAFVLCRQRGIKTILACFSNEGDGYTHPAKMAETILNVNGAGDRWATNFAQMVLDLQPDVVEIMNEPDIGGNPNLTFQAYRDFVVKCCTAFRAAKPDVSIHVQGCPYWNLNDWSNTGTWATKPLIEFDDVTYEVHLYYDRGTSNSDWGKAYQAGNLTEARALLYKYILNTLGLQALIDRELPIIWGETGADVNYPNWKAFLKDLYDFAEYYNQGVILHSLEAEGTGLYGILTPDWAQLNEYGLYGVQELPIPLVVTPAPPIPLWKAVAVWLAILGGAGAALKYGGGGK